MLSWHSPADRQTHVLELYAGACALACSHVRYRVNMIVSRNALSFFAAA